MLSSHSTISQGLDYSKHNQDFAPQAPQRPGTWALKQKAFEAAIQKKASLSEALPLLTEALADFNERPNEACQSPAEKLAYAHYRVSIYQAFEKKLLPQKENNEAPLKTTEAPKSKFKKLSLNISYYFLLTIGMIMDGAGSYLGGQDFINYFFPAITGWMTALIGVSFTIVNSFLFYSFEAGLLRKALGLESSHDLSGKMELDQVEFNSLRNINHFMETKGRAQLTQADFARCQALSFSMNQQVCHKPYYSEPLKEPSYQKHLTTALTFAGSILQASYSYFMAKAFLTSIAPALIGTPIGWLIMGIGIGTMLAYYFSMRGTAMKSIMNPALEKFEQATIEHSHFKEASERYQKLMSLESQCRALKEQATQKEVPASNKSHPSNKAGVLFFEPTRNISVDGNIFKDKTDRAEEPAKQASRSIF